VLSALALASVLYTVKPGDTLSGIAQNYNTTWQAIYDGNQATIHNPNLVYAGEKLRITSGDHATTAAVPVQSAAPRLTAPQAAPSTGRSVTVHSYQVTPAPAAVKSAAQSTPATQRTVTQSTSSGASSAGSGYSTGSLSDIPGVPQSFAACVAYRESTNDTNPAAHGDAYGIIPASGYNVGGDSLAQQKQVFKQIYDTTGPSAWAADGC
jgi:LysM repeat protein